MEKVRNRMTHVEPLQRGRNKITQSLGGLKGSNLYPKGNGKPLKSVKREWHNRMSFSGRVRDCHRIQLKDDGTLHLV